MKKLKNDFKRFQKGNMLIELLLTIALAAIIMPFIFKYQKDTLLRTESVLIKNQMQGVQTALERYIVDNRDSLLKTVGKNITRVELKDLEAYGVNPDFIEENKDLYQLRILKSRDVKDNATLQGVVILVNEDISPLRTKEIVSLGGSSMGVIDGAKTYGTFGTWKLDTLDLGVDLSKGIVGTTKVNIDNDLYLWRLPSNSKEDSQMMVGLNLGNHDIKDINFLKGNNVELNETLKSGIIATKSTVFQNRTTIDSVLQTKSAVVSGNASSDSRNLEVVGAFNLADVAKFSTFTTGDLWVSNLRLSGLSIYTEDDTPSILRINQTLDMTSGRIDALYVTVGFTGSISPRLNVRYKIEDSINPMYYWDADMKVASLFDLSLVELNRMAVLAVLQEKGSNTTTHKIFSEVSSNKNATASDFMNALEEIQKKVKAKYRQLNLQ